MKNTGSIFLMVAWLVMLSISCQEKQPLAFKLTPEEVLQKATSDYLLSAEIFSRFTDEQKKAFILADLRPGAIAEQSPLADAVNIPLADLLDKTSLDLLRSKEKVLLFGESVAQANSARFLLMQVGFENVKILSPAVNDNPPETARYDYAAVFASAKEKHAKELEAGKPKPVIKKVITPQPKAKKKKVVEEEGC